MPPISSKSSLHTPLKKKGGCECKSPRWSAFSLETCSSDSLWNTDIPQIKYQSQDLSRKRNPEGACSKTQAISWSRAPAASSGPAQHALFVCVHLSDLQLSFDKRKRDADIIWLTVPFGSTRRLNTRFVQESRSNSSNCCGGHSPSIKDGRSCLSLRVFPGCNQARDSI